MNDIYLKIKSIRLKNNLTQEEISKKLGMAQSNYARMERGLSQITVDRLQQVAEIFNMTPEAMLMFSEEQGDFKEDAQFYYNQLQKSEGKVRKLEKELANRDEDETDSNSRNQEEKKRLTKSVADLKKEMFAKDVTIKEKQQTIEKLEKEIEEKNKSIGHLQEVNNRLLDMLPKKL